MTFPAAPLAAPLVPLLAVGEVALPALLGFALTRGRGARVVAGTVGLAAAGVGLALALRTVDLWDVVLVATALVGGAVASRLDARRLAQLGVSAALFVAVAEVAGRWALAAHAGVHERVDESLWFEDRERFGEEACHWFVPSPTLVAAAEQLTERAATVPDDAGRVLHVGDSLLGFGPTGPDGDMRVDRRRFPWMLAASDAARGQLNLSLPGVGVDGYAVAVRTLVDAVPVAEVVLYVFPGNDLDELWREYPCCPGGPLVDPQSLAVRCPPWVPLPAPGTLGALVLRSPAPLAVRWLHEVSPTFAQLRAAIIRVRAFRSPFGAELGSYAIDFEGAELDARLDQTSHVLVSLARALAARGVRLTVVGLPFGPALASPEDRTLDTTRAQGRGLAARLSSAGVRYVDAWSAFEGVPYEPAWFMSDGVHFEEAGHRRLAAWLGPKLAE